MDMQVVDVLKIQVSDQCIKSRTTVTWFDSTCSHQVNFKYQAVFRLFFVVDNWFS